VLFKQTRVGTNGVHFKLYKFRTMVVDAEARLGALAERNDRSGPLFKMANDPRVTRVGRFLRASSLDELPQVFNVLRGDMSLVGPRPALPAEVAMFDEELRDRTRVKPGITGLWQIEARDNPSFTAYRRLDLYYVENWSVSLDIVILLATVEHVITRFATAIFGRR
jgi:lipopolysaccharide/colanic/teichoic acid biosynthesis glycosyltransferase